MSRPVLWRNCRFKKALFFYRHRLPKTQKQSLLRHISWTIRLLLNITKIFSFIKNRLKRYGDNWIRSLPVFAGRFCITKLKASLISCESVTSKWIVLRRSLHTAFNSSCPSFVKHVANTLNPNLSSSKAVTLPNPESQPVKRTYFSWKPCTKWPREKSRETTNHTMRTTDASKVALTKLNWSTSPAMPICE